MKGVFRCVCSLVKRSQSVYDKKIEIHSEPGRTTRNTEIALHDVVLKTNNWAHSRSAERVSGLSPPQFADMCRSGLVTPKLSACAPVNGRRVCVPVGISNGRTHGKLQRNRVNHEC